ncbi:MAG: aminodeoxychorismate synthase, component I [Desulfuromonas sp.]|nr:MAG: aminodeoxychorismate synthase, component I [Desulfuromonas sp.]
MRRYRTTAFDPLKIFRHLNPEGPGFLQSFGSSERVARYSIVPLRTAESYRLDHELVRLRNGTKETIQGNPFAALGQILHARKVERSPGSPFPGGYFGYFGYDLAGEIEDLPQRAARDLSMPKLWLDWVDITAVFDHAGNELIIDSLDPAVDLEAIGQQVKAALADPDHHPAAAAALEPVPVLSREQFKQRVSTARDYIAAGDIYQANLSCRFDVEPPAEVNPADLYQRLRTINPSPFACLLQSPAVTIVSSSPERLVSLKDGIAETRPIAGTRPRGYTPPEDSRLGEELLAHPKERAEHIMLLDLERNDLGKVCKTGTVEVDELMVLERYSHVTHIVSNVRGELRDDCGPFDLIRATFPGGTITGVPKKRCMEIIDELEPVGRGIYTGSAGYISASGDMDLNILIRTFQLAGGKLTYQVGAGIVADSDPAAEWEECLAKGRALQLVLGGKHDL